jgi:putative oxidoreductase
MNRLFEQFHAGRIGLAMLVLRTVTGAAFICHGWPKVQNTAAFASHMHLSPFWAATAAYTEVVGGALLILGLLTPLAAGLIGIEMLVALFKVHIPHGDPFVNPRGASYESALLYLCLMVAFMLAGPGAYSLDARMTRRVVFRRPWTFSRRRATS